ncbi:MAG: redox-sensing transcriptional repressor Rex [Bacteroidales bacterium]
MNEREKILRLLAYRTVLQRFRSMGFIRVFSDNIAEVLDISSSLVRKDFSAFGISGTQKGGYHIEDILTRIQGIIGFSEPQRVIIVGAGRIGQALMHYSGFRSSGIEIIAGFDIDSARQNPAAEIPVLPMELLEDFIREQKVRTAVLAVPESSALACFDRLVRAGIRGVLNFTPHKLKGDAGTVVSNINIEHELTNLIYLVNQQWQVPSERHTIIS